MFALHITSPSIMKYTKDTPIIITTNSTMLFDSEEMKFATCLLPSGSMIPEANFKTSMKSTSSISGDKTVAKRRNSPAPPTVFFMRFDDVRIRPIPSLKYEPNIGTYDLIANLAVLIDIPSTAPAVIP